MVNAPVATHTIDFPKFGTVTYSEADVLVFPWGLPGFEQLRAFLVLSMESQQPLLWLQSLEETDIALPLGDPWMFFPDYDPHLPAFARLSLDLDAPEDFTTLAVVVIPESGPLYMNLMAPVIINLKSRIGRQIALEGSNYSVATQIPQHVAPVEPEPGLVQAEPAPE